MVVFAIIGIIALLAVGYYFVSEKFPNIGQKSNDFVRKIFEKFKTKK